MAVCVCVTGSLMYLNEATLLNNVRVRYSKDKIYVSIFYVVTKTLFFMSPSCILLFYD